jgi:hypothetical protein
MAPLPRKNGRNSGHEIKIMTSSDVMTVSLGDSNETTGYDFNETSRRVTVVASLTLTRLPADIDMCMVKYLILIIYINTSQRCMSSIGAFISETHIFSGNSNMFGCNRRHSCVALKINNTTIAEFIASTDLFVRNGPSRSVRMERYATLFPYFVSKGLASATTGSSILATALGNAQSHYFFRRCRMDTDRLLKGIKF